MKKEIVCPHCGGQVPIEKQEKPEPPIPESLRTSLFENAWASWKKHRAERKSKLTPSTMAFQLKKLEGYGHDGALLSIHQSIEHGWMGLFEPPNRPPTATDYANAWK